MTQQDLRAFAKLIGLMFALYLPFLLASKSHGDTLIESLPHDEHISPYAASSPRQWPFAITVDLDATATPQLRQAVEYAAWQWGERIGRKITVMSTGQAGYSTSGKITFGVGLLTSVTTKGQTRIWNWSDTGNIAGAVVTINQLYTNVSPDCFQHIVTHELGHAIGGMGHTSAQHDVMYTYQNQCRYALSYADVQHVPYDASPCFVELTKDGSLMIPNVQGMMAYLKRDGEIWKLGEYRPAQGNCGTVYPNNFDLTFGDIRSQGGNYRAQLRYLGNETWTIESVE
jgi:hypothetical protein